MADDWSRLEVEATVDAYLDMLELELLRQPFNKAARQHALTRLLPRRSLGSVKYKLQNVSAALVDLGFPYVEGYKPYPNYQRLLLEVIPPQLHARPQLLALLDRIVAGPADATPAEATEDVLVEPPKLEERSEYVYERLVPEPRPVRGKNYLEIEARNQSLGRAGELFVLEFEHRRLWRAGRKALAERVEHVSVTQGDGLGYDIHSFDTNGSDRLVEVKTTRFGALTPFYVSRREVEVSEQQATTFHLYRVFNFQTPRLFTLPGPLRSRFVLDAVQYKAKLR